MKKNSKVTRAERIKRAWFLYCEGFSYREIAAELNVSHNQIAKDLKPLIQQWMKDNNIQLDAIRDKELIKLENWDKRITKIFHKSGTDKDSQAKIAREINLKLRIQRQRANILGLNKLMIISTNKNYDMKEFNDDELLRIYKGESPEKIMAERGSNRSTKSRRAS